MLFFCDGEINLRHKLAAFENCILILLTVIRIFFLIQENRRTLGYTV